MKKLILVTMLLTSLAANAKSKEDLEKEIADLKADRERLAAIANSLIHPAFIVNGRYHQGNISEVTIVNGKVFVQSSRDLLELECKEKNPPVK